MNRYRIRTYESGDGDGGIAPGTIVLAVDRGFSLDAASAQDAEQQIHKDVSGGKLLPGRVYQISPSINSSELPRAIAFCPSAKARRVVLEPAMGIYSQFRRLRYVDEALAPQEALLDLYPVPA